jgi:hypothetical protein
MKNSFVYVLLLFTSVACNMVGSETDKISGAYVRETEGTYSKAWDTLDIQKVNKDAETMFTITIKTGYREKLGKNKLGALKHKVKPSLQAVYDEKNKVLQVTEWQRALSVDLAAGTIDNKGSVYTKIN